MFIGVWSAYMSEHNIYAWYPQWSEESIRSPRTRVTDGCEPLYRCWKLNLSPAKAGSALNV